VLLYKIFIRRIYVVNFNVSSTKDNAHAKLSRYVYYGCYTMISRLLVQDVLSVSLSHARFRPRGMLVIARRGYLSRFGPKIFHFEVLFLSLEV